MAEIYNANYVYDMFERYFDTDRETVDKYLNTIKISDNRVVKVDKDRLHAILKGLEESLSRFCFETKADRKHKVAEKLLNKLNYDSFYKNESYTQTKNRIENVYTYTTGKNINVYNIIGSTMLVEANLMIVRNGESKKEITDAYEWAPRMVWNIYDAVRNIGFSDKETCLIFEKAKTVFSKGLSSAINGFYECVLNRYFTVYLNETNNNFINRKTFVEMVKSCPTILTYPVEKIKLNIEYFVKKTRERIKEIKKNENHFEFDAEKLSDDDIIIPFVSDAISKKASILVSPVIKSEFSDNIFKCDEIDKYVDENFTSYISKNLGIKIVNDKEDDYDKLDETELLAKYGNAFDEGMSLEDKNEYYRIVGREDKIVEDDGLGIR